MSIWKQLVLGLADAIIKDEAKAGNPNHDPANGQFTSGGGGDIIKPVKPTKIFEGHKNVPREAEPNAIIEIRNKVGGVGRTYYDSEGKISKQVHGNHNQPYAHPYGKNGEHAHDYKWEDGKVVERTTRELSDRERKENSDIL